MASSNGLLNNETKSPLNASLIPTATEWTENSKRTGLLGRKIGVHPMWLKNGQKVLTTLIQVLHCIWSISYFHITTCS